ncbi:hypothetical protein LNQ03_22770 [Klebsiella pneumoniae subsp. pneumoniae]|nr:hypothetical protein [Klebsiella pneumoniae subsp. pneumoniae]
MEDDYARGKYDGTAEQGPDHMPASPNLPERVMAGLHVTEISLAWLLTKVTAPVIGATQKHHHVDGAVNAVALQLSPEDICYLKKPISRTSHRRDGAKHAASQRPSLQCVDALNDPPCGSERSKYEKRDCRGSLVACAV